MVIVLCCLNFVLGMIFVVLGTWLARFCEDPGEGKIRFSISLMGLGILVGAAFFGNLFPWIIFSIFYVIGFAVVKLH